MAIFTSAKDRARQAEGEAKSAERSAAVLDEQARQARDAAEEARRQLASATKEAAAERKRIERQLTGEVDNLVEDCRGLLAEPPEPYKPVPRDLKLAARAALHGPRPIVSTQVGPVGDNPDFLSSDPTAGMLFGMGNRCGQVADHVSDLVEDSHVLAVRVDEIETEIWKAYIERVRYLAGEQAS